MLQNFFARWAGLISKLIAVLLAVAYLVVISVVEYSPYVWLSLILVLMLCLTLFGYSRDKPLFRWAANRSNTQRTTDNTDQAEMTEVPASVWMTDVPPTYSIVMATTAPATPPPSYGSAIVMFPWIATGQQSPDVSRLLENARFRSVSRQASEVSGNFNCNNTSISRQTSRTETSSHLRPEPISRQTSLKMDNLSTSANQLSAISRQISQLTLLSRQISLQESKQHGDSQSKDDSDIEDDDVFVEDSNHSADNHENQNNLETQQRNASSSGETNVNVNQSNDECK